MPYPEPPSDLIEQWLAEPEYATSEDLHQKVKLVTMTTTRLKKLLNRAAAWGYLVNSVGGGLTPPHP